MQLDRHHQLVLPLFGVLLHVLHLPAEIIGPGLDQLALRVRAVHQLVGGAGHLLDDAAVRVDLQLQPLVFGPFQSHCRCACFLSLTQLSTSAASKKYSRANSVQDSAVLCSSVHFITMQYNTAQYIQCSMMQLTAMQCSAVELWGADRAVVIC